MLEFFGTHFIRLQIVVHYIFLLAILEEKKKQITTKNNINNKTLTILLIYCYERYNIFPNLLLIVSIPRANILHTSYACDWDGIVLKISR
jgi:hypothetical protein